MLRVEGRVVEEVDRRPALPRLDRVRRELAVEVVRAVDVAEVAHVLVVLRRAGEPERVVPPDRVADDLDERLEIVVEELRVEARLRVCAPHQRPGGGRVEPPLLARLQLRGVEREEVGALPSLDVDDLDVLPRLHLVGERRGTVDLEVEPRVGERLRETRLELLERPRPGDLELEVGRGNAAVDDRPRPMPGPRRPRGAAAPREASSPRPAASKARRAPPPSRASGRHHVPRPPRRPPRHRPRPTPRATGGSSRRRRARRRARRSRRCRSRAR